eukprot:8655644-Pyramimonas_sp.AAC.1
MGARVHGELLCRREGRGGCLLPGGALRVHRSREAHRVARAPLPLHNAAGALSCQQYKHNAAGPTRPRVDSQPQSQTRSRSQF